MTDDKDRFQPSKRTAYFILAVLVICALAVRLTFWFEFRASDFHAFLVAPRMDSLIYHTWAERIVAGDILLGDQLFTLSPFYSYLLAFIYAVAGSEMFRAILIQFVLGVLAVPLMYAAGRLVFNRTTGLLAATFQAFYGYFLFVEGFILSEAFLPFLTAFFIWWTARALSRDRAWPFVVSGLILGALFSIRPQYFLVVLLLPLGGLWGAWCRDRASRSGMQERRKMVSRLVFGAFGAALMVLPLGLRNYVVTGKPVMLTVAGGVNFYIGNNREAPGTWQLPRGFRQDQGGMFEDFARRAGGGTFDQTHSRYWFHKGLEEIGDDPGRWARLMLKKGALFWNNYEIPVNIDNAFIGKHFIAARLAFLPFGFLGALCLLGLWMARRERRARWLYVALLGYFGGTILFFLSARYRVAAVPYIILFGAFAAERLIVAARRREWSTLRRPTLMLIAFSVFTFYPLPAKVPPAYTAMQYRILGVHFGNHGELAKAEHWFREALAIAPRDGQLYGDLGMVYFNEQLYRKAEPYLRGALERLGKHRLTPLLWGHLGVVLVETGRASEAERWLRQCTAVFPEDPRWWQALGRALQETGRQQEADEAFRKSQKLSTPGAQDQE